MPTIDVAVLGVVGHACSQPSSGRLQSGLRATAAKRSEKKVAKNGIEATNK